MAYGIAQGAGEPKTWRDISSLIRYAGPYCRVARMINLSQLDPGVYTLQVRVRDGISAQSTAAQAMFTVVR
jgi:hypothetical protein